MTITPKYLTAESALLALIAYVDQEFSSLTAVMQAGQEVAQVGRPAQPYATVMRTGQRDLSGTVYQRIGDELDTPEGASDEQTHELSLTRMREITCEVRFYGDAGPAMAELLPTTVGRISARDLLHTSGIQIRPLGDVLDTRDLRDTTHEASAMIEIGVMYAIEDLTSVGTIETVASDITGASVDYDVTYTP